MAKYKTLNDFDPSTFTTTAEGDDLSASLLNFPEPDASMAPPFAVPGDGEPITPDFQSNPFALPTGVTRATRKRNGVARLLNTTEPRLLSLAVVVLVLAGVVLLIVAATQLPAIIAGNSPTQAVERFVAALNTGDKDKIRATLDPEMRQGIDGLITDFTSSIAGAAGVKWKQVRYTEGPRDGNVTSVKATGTLEYTLTSQLGEIIYRKGFNAEIATVKRGEQWYVLGLNGFVLSDSGNSQPKTQLQI